MDRSLNTSGRFRNFARVGGLALLAATVLGLSGCKSVSKSDYDAAVNENAELRTRVQALEAAQNAKDTTIAELSRTGDQGNAPASTYGTNVPATGTNTGYDTTPTDPDFQNHDGHMVAEIAGDVLFASGQATVKTDARKQLDRIAKTLNTKYQGATIRIEGHTDWDPINKSRNKWKSNQELSEARAAAVKTYLAGKGVSSSRIMTTGLGDTQRKSTKAASRRVEIIVLGN